MAGDGRRARRGQASGGHLLSAAVPARSAPERLAGPVLGVAVAWACREPTAAWLLCGAVAGGAGEWVARRLVASERTAVDRALAYGLVLLAALLALPALAFGGSLPGGPDVSVGRALAVVSATAAGAALATAGRLLLERRRALGADRRERRRAAAPDRARWARMGAAIVMVVAIGWADYRLPAPYSLDFLYLLPVLVVAWFTGAGGAVPAVLSAEAHALARGLAHSGGLSPALSTLESSLIVAGLAAEAVLLARIRRGLDRETAAARTDLLTGLMNRKAFLERVESELRRATEGEPVSLAYLDLDGFKGVNDRFGHAAGDDVLRVVAGVLLVSLRASDAAARLGGDEFAALLPATDAEGAARVVERLRAEVESRMHDFEWRVTCSVGVVTGVAGAVSVEELMRTADELMYSVKHGGKNAARQAVLSP